MTNKDKGCINTACWVRGGGVENALKQKMLIMAYVMQTCQQMMTNLSKYDKSVLWHGMSLVNCQITTMW